MQAGEREDGGGGWCVDVGVCSGGALVAGIVKMSFDFIRHWNIFPYLNRVISDSPLVSLDISLEINSRHESKGMSRRSSKNLKRFDTSTASRYSRLGALNRNRCSHLSRRIPDSPLVSLDVKSYNLTVFTKVKG